MTTLRHIRYGLWGAVAAAFCGWLWLNYGAAAGLRAQAAPPAIAIGGPFELTDENGTRFSSAQLAGRPFALYFGFTHCPVICPEAMLAMTSLLAETRAPADFPVLFITVDPERDTPGLLKLYTDAFDPRIIGLSGTAEEIAAVAKSYRAFYRRVETSGSYTMDHTASVYLMDAQGRLAATIAHGEATTSAAAKLRRLLGGAGS